MDLSHRDLLDCRTPAEPALSGSGRYAFVLPAAPVPRGERPRSPIYVGRLDGPEPKPITGDGQDALPTRSPDGTLLAFASDRDDSPVLQPYLLTSEDAEPRRLAELPGAVESIKWNPDGRSLLLGVAESGVDRSGAAGGTAVGEVSADPIVLRPRQAWRRIYRIDLDLDADLINCRRIGPDGLNVWEFDWRGGPVLAIVSDDPSENAWYDARLVLIDPGSGKITDVHRSSWQLGAPTLSDDGRVAFVEGYASDRGQGLGEPVVVDLATGTVRILGPGLDVQRLQFLADGRLFCVGQRGLTTWCGLLSPEGELDELWSGPGTIGRIHLHDASPSDNADRILASFQAPGRPPELCLLDRSESSADPVKRWRPLTRFNDHLRERQLPQTETIAWAGDDGTEIQGILVRPPSTPPGPLPLIVYAHGGPNNAWTLGFAPGYSALGMPLAAAGYAVLFPNQRGSSGRGQDFTRATIGDYGAMDLRDVLAGVDRLAADGVIDRSRVGIIGGSAGGYLAAWAATAGRDAFAAAVPIACVSNWVSFHNTSNIPRLTEIEYGSDAYDPAGQHTTMSPIMHVRGATTPTLIIHGELDRCTPLGQAQELYQGLVSEGCEAELVIYPREGHSIMERDHLEDMWQRVRAWFDRQLRVSVPSHPTAH